MPWQCFTKREKFIYLYAYEDKCGKSEVYKGGTSVEDIGRDKGAEPNGKHCQALALTTTADKHKMGAPRPRPKLKVCCSVKRISAPPLFPSCHWNKEYKQYCGCVCSLITTVRSLIRTTERLTDLYLTTGVTFPPRSRIMVPKSHPRTHVLPGLNCWCC